MKYLIYLIFIGVSFYTGKHFPYEDSERIQELERVVSKNDSIVSFYEVKSDSLLLLTIEYKTAHDSLSIEQQIIFDEITSLNREKYDELSEHEKDSLKDIQRKLLLSQ